MASGILFEVVSLLMASCSQTAADSQPNQWIPWTHSDLYCGYNKLPVSGAGLEKNVLKFKVRIVHNWDRSLFSAYSIQCIEQFLHKATVK